MEDGPWVTLKIEEKDVDEFYATLGKCINHWAFIEREYFDLLRVALGCTKMQASILYYSWGTFGVRAANVNTLLVDHISNEPKRLAQWDTLNKQVKDLAIFRNRLAHEPIKQEMRATWDLEAEGGPKVIDTNVSLHIHKEPNKLLSKPKDDPLITLASLQAHLADAQQACRQLHGLSNILQSERAGWP